MLVCEELGQGGLVELWLGLDKVDGACGDGLDGRDGGLDLLEQGLCLEGGKCLCTGKNQHCVYKCDEMIKMQKRNKLYKEEETNVTREWVRKEGEGGEWIKKKRVSGVMIKRKEI